MRKELKRSSRSIKNIKKEGNILGLEKISPPPPINNKSGKFCDKIKYLYLGQFHERPANVWKLAPPPSQPPKTAVVEAKSINLTNDEFVTALLKPDFHMVVTVVKIESRSFSSAEIQHFRMENTRSDYN